MTPTLLDDAVEARLQRELLGATLDVRTHIDAHGAQLDRERAQLERLDARCVRAVRRSSGSLRLGRCSIGAFLTDVPLVSTRHHIAEGSDISTAFHTDGSPATSECRQLEAREAGMGCGIPKVRKPLCTTRWRDFMTK
jgi:hypothetical protein